MKKIMISSMMLLAVAMAGAQTTTGNTTNTGSDKVYNKVSDMPQPGFDANTYFKDNVNYPELEKSKKIEGIVYVSFIVEKDGSVSNVKLVKGVDNGPGLDKEALRVVSAMPKWTPGKKKGQPVRVAYNLPIMFKLS